MISTHSIDRYQPVWLMSSAGSDDERAKPLGDRPSEVLRSLRVLIVEDEFFISLSTEFMLESLGHVVVGIAVSADEAERIAELERPDVVLMDIRLIGSRDGIEAAKNIYATFGIRSIFVTANSDAHTRQRARVAHPLGFIVKPLTERHLRDELSALS
jgi:CheY-like chemotaxis protein